MLDHDTNTAIMVSGMAQCHQKKSFTETTMNRKYHEPRPDIRPQGKRPRPLASHTIEAANTEITSAVWYLRDASSARADVERCITNAAECIETAANICRDDDKRRKPTSAEEALRYVHRMLTGPISIDANHMLEIEGAYIEECTLAEWLPVMIGMLEGGIEERHATREKCYQ
jgi:hypothetical protein